MKKQLLRFVLAFSAFLALGTGAMAQVVNGGFETGALPPFTATTPDGSVSIQTDSPHTGTYYLQGFENTGDGDLSQPLSTVPGRSYTISAWVRTSGDTINNFARLALGTNPPVTCPALTTEYVLCTASFVAQSSSDALHVYFKTISGSGTVWIDDIQIQAPPVAQPVPTLNTALLALLSLLLLVSAAWRVRQPK